ncbi:MAG: 2-amino-4-hydroxy-6-hydroxymethyldihydropteridine diphosphokinase [Alphaproteobacteria bacterium]
MILIGLGANLPSRFGGPEDTLRAAVSTIRAEGVRVVKESSVWLSAPVPVSDQPWYRNAVIAVQTDMGAFELLKCLQRIEGDFGRERSVRNAPRVLDLDLLAYRDVVIEGEGLRLPHPRMEGRAFVLMPLAEVAPRWRHPVTGMFVQDLIEKLPEGQEIEISGGLAA